MALFENKDNIESKVKQMREWTTEETEVLKSMIKEKRPLGEIAKALNKKDFAVIMRTRYISGFEDRNAKGTKPKNFYDDTASVQDKYPERMQRWSDDDNVTLKRLYIGGDNIFTLAHHFHRTPKGVLMHLQEIFTAKEKVELFNSAAQLVGMKRVIRADQPIAEEEPDTQEEQSEVSLFKRNEIMVKNLSQTVKSTLAMIDEGLTIKEIAKRRKLNPNTIIGHIQQMIEVEVLNVDDFVDTETYNIIIEAGNSVGWESLSKIKETISEDISYESIRYVMADVNRLGIESEEESLAEDGTADQEQDTGESIPISWIMKWLKEQSDEASIRATGKLISDYIKDLASRK